MLKLCILFRDLGSCRQGSFVVILLYTGVWCVFAWRRELFELVISLIRIADISNSTQAESYLVISPILIVDINDWKYWYH